MSAPVVDELIELRGLRFHYRDWASKTPGAPDLVLLSPEALGEIAELMQVGGIAIVVTTAMATIMVKRS